MARWIAIVGLILCVAGPARAAAPPPQKSVDMDRALGRWYEILRTPNSHQQNCFGAYQDWSRKGAGFAIRQVCHHGSATGPEDSISTTARSLNPQNTEFELSFLGGLIHIRYLVTDHADDYSWVIGTTEGGHYPKLLARTPGLPPAQVQALKELMARLGFDIAKLQAVGQ
jgi:apolipoprotein D and lipocalin family protein